MFQRGQKIAILKSSASKKAHPAVGDVGYLNNMYLFFKDRFILLDAFFLSYKQDRKTGKDRCERKRFLIDMGMKDSLKYRLMEVGMPRKFFTNNSYTANLTPVNYTFADGHYREYPNTMFTWNRIHNNKGESLIDRKVKIPYGQIIALPNAKKPINEEGINALDNWMSCLYPVLSVEMGLLRNGMFEARTIGNMAASRYNNSLGEFLVDKNSDIINAKAIEDMRMIQVLGKFLIDNCDRAFLKSNDVAVNKHRMKYIWGAPPVVDKLIKITNDRKRLPKHVTKGLIGVFFRAILMNGDTKSQLTKLRISGILTWDKEYIQKVAKKIDKVKQEANSNSAALARIFEGLF